MKIFTPKLFVRTAIVALLFSAMTAGVLAEETSTPETKFSVEASYDLAPVQKSKVNPHWLELHADEVKPDHEYVMNLQSIDKELFCMAINNYYEASGEGLKGKVAVSEVVSNRAANSNYPSTICGVVKQAVNRGGSKICQFSWVCYKTFGRPVADKPESRAYKEWYDSVVAAILVHHKKVTGVVAGATHFYLKSLNPIWSHNGTTVAVGTVGNHKFVRLK